MPFDARIAPIRTAAAACTVCPSARRCLLAAEAGDPACRMLAPFQTHALPHAGKELFAAGRPADAVYMVRAGCIKTFTVDPDGNERVRGFHFPGDIVGLDALGSPEYPAHAVAVVPSQVCRVTLAQLHAGMAASPELARRLMERAGQRLREALALSGDYTADQRVAAFLLQMRARIETDGRAGGIRLPMPRRDIANHLRLATETVCRVLTRFQRAGWLSSRDKVIHLDRPEALAARAAPVGLGCAELRLAA